MGAISVHPKRTKHAQLDAIFTHTVAMLLVNVVKSAPSGLERVKIRNFIIFYEIILLILQEINKS